MVDKHYQDTKKQKQREIYFIYKKSGVNYIYTNTTHENYNPAIHTHTQCKHTHINIEKAEQFDIYDEVYLLSFNYQDMIA